MTAAECAECGWSGELTKEPDEYESGPRCGNPDCRSRDIDLQVGEPQPRVDPVAAEAFEHFEAGGDPVGLVKKGVCGPDRARDLLNRFNDLAGDYALLSGERIAEIRESAYQDGLAAGRKEAQQRAATAFENGRNQAWTRARQVLKTAKRL